MTKKHDFLRDAQSRQKHPGKHQVGSLAYLQANAEQQHQRSDPQEPGMGKLANDHNMAGQQLPTQANPGRRTPASRHERQTMGAGPLNQSAARQGGGGAGRTPRGSG